MGINSGYIRLTKITIFLSIFVVFAGSMVKVTGSGMGCPDWPKCFGYYIPPFDEEQLIWKSNFHYNSGEMIFWQGDLLKANKGFSTTSAFTFANWSIYDEHDYKIYDPIHTIIEYINRLVSVLLGFSVLLMIVFAFKSSRLRKMNLFFAFLSLSLIGFNAWLGKLVVEGVLNPSDISAHMLAAFVLIIALSFTHTQNSTPSSMNYSRLYKGIQMGCFLYLLYQLLIGVILRQTFDTYSDVSRELWVENAGINFLLHRSSSLLYATAVIITYTILKTVPKSSFEWKNFKWVILLTLAEIFSGAIMGYLQVPKSAQPFHVIVSSILLVVQSNLFFKIFFKVKHNG
jgi:cytochrome c oxidase assembly protein subunit 15